MGCFSVALQAENMETSSQIEKLNERIVELEISLTHQQELVAQLNSVVTQQAKSFQVLQTAFQQMKAQQQSLRDLVTERSAEAPQEKPPHY